MMRLLLAATIPILAAAVPELSTGATTVTIDTTKRYQEIDGFGFSEAFQRANLIVNLPAAKQQNVLDVLFNTTTGAGFSILRIGIGSSTDSSSDHMNTIEPKNPGGPSATPAYVWDGKDSGQVFVAQQAVKYGVSTFYGNAWSAPAFMKTNNNVNNGGYLCGVSGASCSSGDWKQAYANYLIQWSQYYLDAGVKMTHLGFLNEPQNAASYASMLSSGTQAADFIKVLYPTLQKNANFSSVQIACCDGEGWSDQQGATAQLKSAGVESQLGIVTSHTYTSGFSGPINTRVKVWQTEYSDLNGGWTTAWYGGGGAGDGMTWASQIHTALTSANCSAYLYWVATQGGNTNEKMIQIDGSNNVAISKRVWAFAQFSRYVRPGATRIGVSGGGISISAFQNLDGSVVVPCLNTGSGTASLTLSVKGFNATAVTAWITDNSHEMASTAATLASDGTVAASIPGRTFITYVFTTS